MGDSKIEKWQKIVLTYSLEILKEAVQMAFVTRKLNFGQLQISGKRFQL